MWVAYASYHVTDLGGKESGVKPSVHDNIITNNKIAVSPAALEFTSYTATGSHAPLDAPATADPYRWIGTFSFNVAHAPDGKALASDPSLRMKNNNISQNQDISRQPAPLDQDPENRSRRPECAVHASRGVRQTSAGVSTLHVPYFRPSWP